MTQAIYFIGWIFLMTGSLGVVEYMIDIGTPYGRWWMACITIRDK